MPTLSAPDREENIRRVFEISILLKGIHAFIEIATSVAVLFISPSLISRTVYLLTQEELTEDPKDLIANYLLNASRHFSGDSQLFIFLYLIGHGIIKVFLAYHLLKKRLWAYPVSIAALILFIFYQAYRYSLTHSFWLIVLTAFDLFVLWLVWHEYRFMRKNPAKPILDR